MFNPPTSASSEYIRPNVPYTCSSADVATIQAATAPARSPASSRPSAYAHATAPRAQATDSHRSAPTVGHTEDEVRQHEVKR